jgi:hypothetical protein
MLGVSVTLLRTARGVDGWLWGKVGYPEMANQPMVSRTHLQNSYAPMHARGCRYQIALLSCRQDRSAPQNTKETLMVKHSSLCMSP